MITEHFRQVYLLSEACNGRIQSGDRGSGPPENHKNIGFPSNIEPDPLKITNMRGSRNFRQVGGGGGGGPGQSGKKSSDNVFFCSFLFSPQLILQKSNGQFQRNLSFFKVPEGSTFSRGGGGGVSNFFQGGGVQLLIPYRNPYNL